jgi:hypothetical protein
MSMPTACGRAVTAWLSSQIAGVRRATLRHERACSAAANRDAHLTVVAHKPPTYNAAMSQRPPVAVCTSCGTYSFNVAAINQGCGERRDRKRCRGVYGSAVNVGDWQQCSACGGGGRAGGERCPGCQGTGWEYVRGQPR